MSRVSANRSTEVTEALEASCSNLQCSHVDEAQYLGIAQGLIVLESKIALIQISDKPKVKNKVRGYVLLFLPLSFCHFLLLSRDNLCG